MKLTKKGESMKKLLSILLIALLLVGCGSQTSKPESTTKGFLEALKAYDAKKMNSFIVEDARMSEDELKETEQGFIGNDREMGTMIMKAVFKEDFQIDAAKIDGDKAVVPVKWKGAEIGTIIGNYMGKTFALMMDSTFVSKTEEEQSAAYKELLKEAIKETEAVDIATELKLIKKDGQWFIESLEEANADFLNDALGIDLAPNEQ